jgi:protein-disulfide isomerase
MAATKKSSPKKAKKAKKASVSEVASMASNPYSFTNFVDFANNNFTLILIAGLMFIAGFFFGSVWTENELIKSGGVGIAAAPSAGDRYGNDPAAPPAAPVEKIPKITKDDHIRGNRNAKVILVEYSDFECPFCARFHPTIAEVAENNDDVAWVYRHYPLAFHPNAQKAAEGSECVADLAGDNAFWVYSDSLSEANAKAGKLSPEDIQSAAQAAGVNMAKFNTCLDSGEMADIVTAQQTGGTAAGVTGTPGTIVVTKDGGQELISGALPLPQVQAVVDRYL